MNPFVAPASTVVGWLSQGCNATNEIPPPAPGPCAKAKKVLQRGDSLETLGGNPEALAEISAYRAAAHSNDQVAYAKALIDSVLESSSEREWLGDMRRNLEP